MAKCSQLIQLPSLISSEFSKVKGEVGFGVVVLTSGLDPLPVGGPFPVWTHFRFGPTSGFGVVVVLRSLDDSGRYFVES